MKKFTTKDIVYCALFAALACVATAFTKIPIPGIADGYVHVGDTVIFVAALILPGVQAAAVGAIGSAMADVIVGAAIYAAPTFIIKGLAAFIVWLVANRAGKKAVALLAGSAIIVLGYFLYEVLFLSIAPAPAGISALYNVLQVGVSFILSLVILPLVKRAVI